MSSHMYANEVGALLPKRAIYVPDIGAFGELGSWTVSRIYSVLHWRGRLGNPSELTAADTVVVACPEVSYADLATKSFKDVWTKFARRHGLNLMVSFYTTYKAWSPDSENDRSFFQTFNFGDPEYHPGGHLKVIFFVKDALELDGTEKFWQKLLGDHGLRLAPIENANSVPRTFAKDPEQVIGLRLVFHNWQTRDYTELVIVRPGDHVPVRARAFRLVGN